MEAAYRPAGDEDAGRSPSLFWLLQVGGWIAFAGAVSIGRIGEMPMPAVVVLDWSLAVLGFFATLALGAVYSRLRIRGASLVRVLTTVVLVSFLAASLWTAVYHLYVDHAASALLSALSGLDVPLGRGGGTPQELLDNNIYNTLVLLAWSMLYIGSRYYAAMREEREHRLRAEAQAHQAQLRALRYQLNPHFLFNTLNAISTLVVQKREREATGMIARLSEFLRLTMEGDGVPEVPLADELDFVRRYLEIEQVRFGDRLQVVFDVDDEVLGHPVPSLLLQPLVENAIKHAIAPREEGGRILVAAHPAGRHLLLRVVDDGRGLRAAPHLAPGGIGLSNTRQRLKELYGEDHRLELEEGPGGGLAVSVHLPLRPSPIRRLAGAV